MATALTLDRSLSAGTVQEPGLAPDAERAMLGDQARFPHLECSWALDWEGEELVSPRLLRRGSAHSVNTPIAELRPGECCIHSHPSGSVEPTPEDLEWAETAARMNHGFGVVAPWNQSLELLFIVAPRRPPAPSLPTWAKRIGPVLISLAWVGRRPGRSV